MLITSQYKIHDFFNERIPMDIEIEKFDDVKKDYYWVSPRIRIYKKIPNKLYSWVSCQNFYLTYQSYAD